jgi:hypothetical protein
LGAMETEAQGTEMAHGSEPPATPEPDRRAGAVKDGLKAMVPLCD